ncbi:hypothetical protein SARC_03359 [Sphaeroforma arctica JP610]|uniref:Uncharacterized protein n=1 Tax=Sphaeroforma arctica JP610 TaxID=667725 RepID=A0A0L0G5X9_9EUKA|nr:hypothetical protein SARC_03359 [Sphaeroforma arctica JP610]KNC84432.1 hypothetical protein SARC_03359 [Sphaeroforma arctica JP610]|eukprot:XP_014158334.1 hypothetical protein SARC_03359 [Sphaeroforma arctica JP610]
MSTRTDLTPSQQDLSYYEQALSLVEQARSYVEGVMKSRAEGATLRETVVRDALEQVLTMVHTVAEKVGGQQQIEHAVAILEARGAFGVLTEEEKALVMKSLDPDHHRGREDTSVPETVPDTLKSAVKVAKVMRANGEIPAKSADKELKGDIVVEKVCDRLENGEKFNAVEVVSREMAEPIEDRHKKSSKKAKQKELEQHVKKVDNGEAVPSIVLSPPPAAASSSPEVERESVVPKGGAPIQLENKKLKDPVTVPKASDPSTFSNIEAKYDVQAVNPDTVHIKPNMNRQTSTESTGSQGRSGDRANSSGNTSSRSPSPRRGLREKVKGIFHKSK